MIPQKKVLYNQLSRNRSNKVTDVLKWNGKLQNVPYCHAIIVINNMNNIQISYQSAISRLQDKSFFFLRRIYKNLRKIWRGVITPKPHP
jgi:hypothetical protein